MKESNRIVTWIMILLAAFLLVGTAVALDYDWTGLGDGTTWSDGNNWTDPPGCGPLCYPSESGDNANIEVSGGETVTLVDEMINDLVVQDTGTGSDAIVLTGGGTQKVLTCGNMVSILGPPSSGETIVILAGKGVLETQ